MLFYILRHTDRRLTNGSVGPGPGREEAVCIERGWGGRLSVDFVQAINGPGSALKQAL